MASSVLGEPTRLGPITGVAGSTNEVIFVPPVTTQPHLSTQLLVYFGGDVQDYPEVMAAHRDHQRYVAWSLTHTAQLLSAKFPTHTVLVVKPSRMERKTFSCYDNFVESNNVGVPSHHPGVKALTHLAALLSHTIHRVQAAGGNHSTSWDQTVDSCTVSSQPASTIAGQHPDGDPHCHQDMVTLSPEAVLTLVGFSKGCVVLNQLATEMYTVSTIPDHPPHRMVTQLITQIRHMYWLDGGHAGGQDTWLTSPSILHCLAAVPQLTLHIHVSPYQVHDMLRPWIGKECKTFRRVLQRAGAKVLHTLHFAEEPPSLLLHFQVLNRFS